MGIGLRYTTEFVHAGKKKNENSGGRKVTRTLQLPSEGQSVILLIETTNAPLN